ncbi:SDR family NAD(P)-dependent oxidoreductase, partial [Methylobacterium sp. WL18]
MPAAPTARYPPGRPSPEGRFSEASMDLGLSGRRALVCAASKGLGRGCAL